MWPTWKSNAVTVLHWGHLILFFFLVIWKVLYFIPCKSTNFCDVWQDSPYLQPINMVSDRRNLVWSFKAWIFLLIIMCCHLSPPSPLPKFTLWLVVQFLYACQVCCFPLLKRFSGIDIAPLLNRVLSWPVFHLKECKANPINPATGFLEDIYAKINYIFIEFPFGTRHGILV